MPDEVQILVFKRRLDLSRTVEAVEEVIERGGRRLIVNLRTLDLTTSVDVAALIRVQTDLRERGGELVLSQPGLHFLRFLKALGLSVVLKAFQTNDEALAYFGGADGAGGVIGRLVAIEPTRSAHAKASNDE